MKQVGRLPIDKDGNLVCGEIVKTKNEADEILEIRKQTRFQRQNSQRLQIISDMLKFKFGQ